MGPLKKTDVALLAGATLWSVSIVAAPVWRLTFIYSFFSQICHQQLSRSWSIAGAPFAVCVRCASIYFAFTVSLWLGLKTNTRWLRLSLLFMGCEFILARLVLDSALLRSASGILVGLSTAPFVRQALEEVRGAM